MFFNEFISKLSSFNSFLIIDLKDQVIIINEIIDKNEQYLVFKHIKNDFIFIHL